MELCTGGTLKSIADSISARLRAWFQEARRDLPWRRTRDPWAILISEVMLQQTRVAAVIPYYERFLDRFPDPAALAAAPEAELLALWAGLGYYSRARNLQAAARQITQSGSFPDTYAAIRELKGVGSYTAAAVASIAFGLPHAVLDGNVLRVAARLTGDSGDIRHPATRRRLQLAADEWLDRGDPGTHNQALMELGATVCLPRQPQCLLCPIASVCRARESGRASELPIKGRPGPPIAESQTVLWIEKHVAGPNGRELAVLLVQRPAIERRLAGFWELPDCVKLPGARHVEELGILKHAIVNHSYTITIRRARLRSVPKGFSWVEVSRLLEMPITTVTRKALQLRLSERGV
jgi:A/G-specific adenine glycosylase